MSETLIRESIDYLNETINLGYWFYLKLYDLAHYLTPDDQLDLDDLALIYNASTLTTAEEKVEIAEALDKYFVYDVQEGNGYVPAYYDNTYQLIRELALIITAYYVDEPTTPNISKIYNTFVANADYLLSDENEYKVPAFLMPFINDVKEELIAEYNALLAP